MNQQEQITKWFDETYRRRGLSYLRPIEAYLIFLSILEVKPGTKLLDVACGPGLLLKAASTMKMEVFGTDISGIAIAKAREICSEAHVEIGNAEQLVYDDDFFDYVTCIGSLERMINREQVLTEVHRVLKMDGKACFMVRNAHHFWWRWWLAPLGLQNDTAHQDAQDLSSWTKIFEGCGFKVVNIYPDHWPYYRTMKLLIPWKKMDTSRIRQFPWRLENSYEFIFLLEKI